jgi:adenylate kinase family enzyme
VCAAAAWHWDVAVLRVAPLLDRGGSNCDILFGVARIVVIGAAGSGKTTLARAAAAKLGLTSIDLDDLFWEPGWQHVDGETLRSRVEAQTASPGWIVAGNYTSHVRDLLWPRATTLVWLDLPRRTSFRRVVLRTFIDAVRRRELWPGCRQTFRAPFKTRLFHLAWEQPSKFRYRYEGFLAEPGSAHLDVVRLNSTREVSKWLRSIPVPTR